jgi:hypothetical protein
MALYKNLSDALLQFSLYKNNLEIFLILYKYIIWKMKI